MPSSRAFQWLSLVGVIWLQSLNGTNFNFPAYSSQLKNLLSMSQLQLNNLAFASDAGKLLGWLSGIAAAYLPLWLVLMMGSTIGLIGYGLQYLFITDHVPNLVYWHIFLLGVLAGNSICWINTVCYVVSIRNFPSDRQVAVGLSTSYQGLSAKIYTDVVDALFSSSVPIKRAKAYLLLNSVLPLVGCLVAAPLVAEINIREGQKLEGGFVVMFVITIVTGIYAVISSLGLRSSGFSPMNNLIGIGLFLLAPLVVPVGEKIREFIVLEGKWLGNRENRVCDFTIERIECGDGVEMVENEGKERVSSIRDACDGVNEKEEIGVMLMVRKVEFWLYFCIYLSGATIGLVFLNNLGQIAESRGYSRTSSLVSLSSSFGFFGRLMPSLLDYFFSRNKHIVSRPASIAALMAPMSAAFFLLLNSTTFSLYTSTAIIGICTGAITSISVSTTTELFGKMNFSINHNIVVANIPIGSFLFGYLAAFLYRRAGNGDGRCMGMECYRVTFIIWGSLCFFGTILALILHARTRKLYSQRL